MFITRLKLLVALGALGVLARRGGARLQGASAAGGAGSSAGVGGQRLRQLAELFGARMVCPPEGCEELEDPSNELGEGYGKRSHLNGDDYEAYISMGGIEKSLPMSNPIMGFVPRDDNSGCGCKAQGMLRDLGLNRYPRYLTSYSCSGDYCGVGAGTCKPLMYKMWVLKLKGEGDISGGHTPVMPAPLRESYLYEQLEVAVGCHCAP